ncbi:MAG: hypothetical protein E3K40_00920 [Candidatus Brocadia sp.]|nr:hypothetical protein [Candidatus Brocadia sp.]
MNKVEKAIEMTATINAKRQLVLDESLPIVGPQKVRVIILLQEEIEIDEKEWLKLASINDAFGFLKEPDEDVYAPSDGKPFHD